MSAAAHVLGSVLPRVVSHHCSRDAVLHPSLTAPVHACVLRVCVCACAEAAADFPLPPAHSMWRTVMHVAGLIAIAAGTAGAAPLRLSSAAPTSSLPYSGTLAHAAHLIAQSQVNTSSPFNPPWSLEKTQDIFPSFVGLNFVGGPLNSTLRHAVQIWDNNAFVSNWIIQMQLECAKIGVVGLTDAAAMRTVNLTLGFQEHLDSADTGAMDFWFEHTTRT